MLFPALDVDFFGKLRGTQWILAPRFLRYFVFYELLTVMLIWNRVTFSTAPGFVISARACS